MVNGRYVISPSPIPRWDTPKLHQAAHLTLLSAGREKRLYAVPPYTDVYPLEFTDVPFQVEHQEGWTDRFTGLHNKFMTEVPQPDGSVQYEISDTGYIEKIKAQQADHPNADATPGRTYYDDQGKFYRGQGLSG